ncbi:nuclear transport factor 2 family protein [Nocardia altamirensis]|uniref:nuclear transport factor 2 family protein n=1 Tax=Nocardia altamirensis TaxID=472158 RepID=UPI00084075E0|nr:nuclear transport factor 2 family protein [Nocardia altamirensis]
MNPRPPEQFIADFFTAYTAAAVDQDNDPDEVIDRFHTLDIVQVADGIRLDRARLVAHLKPVRKNLRDYRFEVHEAFVDGERFAARMTVHAQLRKADAVVTEVFMFGEFASDGRLRRAEQLTRKVG